MKHPVRILLLTGSALAMGAGLAFAQMEPPPQPDMFGGPMGEGHGRMGGKFLGDFDANHDGKITKDEFKAGLARKYAQLAAKSGGVTLDSFLGSHLKEFRQMTDEKFRRADWNNDGKLSLDEFSVGPKAKFMLADKDGLGAISCAPHDKGGPGAKMMKADFTQHHPMMAAHWRGMGERCAEADINHDGKVTRAEVDKTIQIKFTEAAKGGNAVTPDEFYNLELARLRDMAQKRFDRADSNHDGKLSEAEFDVPAQKIFDHLDRNHDGVITADELKPQHGMRGGWRHGDDHNKDNGKGSGPQ
jgi:Ca2+-binding EF-hand superfamily protein